MTSKKLGTDNDFYILKSCKGAPSSIPINVEMQSTHAFLPPSFPKTHKFFSKEREFWFSNLEYSFTGNAPSVRYLLKWSLL